MTGERQEHYGTGIGDAGAATRDPDGDVGPLSFFRDDTSRRRQRRWGRRLLIALLSPILLVAGFVVYLDLRLSRADAPADFAGRPADTPGTNWLIVGSDSRAGLSKDQRHTLHTGGGVGQRTDSIMMLHIGDHGTTLVSLPRDSYLPIAGHGNNKLNASFAFGGPKLLTRTIEKATGIRIDHYAEIGFGGFVGMVNAVGGVRLCVKQPVRDKKAGLDLTAGCQMLKDEKALGYVRARHAFAGGDLDRVKHQREFLAALVRKATSPGVLLNPFRTVPFSLGAADNFTVGNGDHLYDLAGFVWAMRSVTKGHAVMTTVPVKGGGSAPGVGSYVKWDTTRAAALFTALRKDRPVPKTG